MYNVCACKYICGCARLRACAWHVHTHSHAIPCRSWAKCLTVTACVCVWVTVTGSSPLMTNAWARSRTPNNFLVCFSARRWFSCAFSKRLETRLKSFSESWVLVLARIAWLCHWYFKHSCARTDSLVDCCARSIRWSAATLPGATPWAFPAL